MKKAPALLIFVLMSQCLAGQSFISESKQWNLRFSYFANLTTEIFKFDGDTTYGGHTYHKMLCSYDSLTSWHYMGGLREEGNSVYYYHPEYGEGLLYDFNVDTGDTIHIRNYFCSDQNVPVLVTGTDTFITADGPRKRWHLEALNQQAPTPSGLTDQWIEGIGSLQGPLYSLFEYCIVCPYWELQCYYEDHQLVYIMPFTTTCFDVGSGIEEYPEKSVIYLSPNPVNRGGTIRVTAPGGIVSATLYDGTGREVYTIHPGGDQTFTMTADVPGAGWHLVRLTSSDNTRYTGKILVR